MANFDSNGDPLTGALTGTDGDDTYVGRYLGDSPQRPAIQELKLTDLSGASTLQAINVLAAGWSPEGITRSEVRLGDGSQSIGVEVIGNGSIRGIAGSSIEMGAGPSLTEISLSTGSTTDNRHLTGVEGSSFKAGAGNDVLAISVEDTTEGDGTENYLRGIAGNLAGVGVDMGDGDDRITLDVNNLPDRPATGLDSSKAASAMTRSTAATERIRWSAGKTMTSSCSRRWGTMMRASRSRATTASTSCA